MRLSFIFNPNILKQGSPIRSQAAHWEEHNGGQAREALFAAPHGLLPMAHITTWAFPCSPVCVFHETCPWYQKGWEPLS